MPIKLLDNSLINKIAAGEVVERPSSVVKELVENAVDAGATEITVEIENGGKTLIKVSDNGCGINHNEIALAFSRHATSKIESLIDLENINSLGFRGEALSSISSVSNVEVITKTETDDLALSVELSQGSVVNEKLVQRLQGTTFIVRDIFFNVPVRLKFLKKNSVESSAISDIVTNLILSNPDIAFRFINNGQTLLRSEGDGNLDKILQQIAGSELRNNLIEVNYKKNNIEIKGVISNLKVGKSTRKNEYLFINARFVKNKMISDAIESFYNQEFQSKKYPVFALNLKLNPQEVDVNVHPTKLEVRFVDETAIHDAFTEAIKLALEGNKTVESQVPSVDFKLDKNMDIRLVESKKVETKPIRNVIKLDQLDIASLGLESVLEEVEVEKTINNNRISSLNLEDDSIKYENTLKPNNNMVNDVAVELEEEEELTRGESIAQFLYTTNYDIKPIPRENSQNNKVDRVAVVNKGEVKFTKPKEVNKNHDYKVVGQVFGTYWLLEKGEEIFFFDQHAGHEIYLYYKFLSDFSTKKVHSQILLEPKIVTLDFKQSEYLLNNIELFEQFGYVVEVFDDNIYTLKSVPIIFEEPSSVHFFVEMITELSESEKEVENIYEFQKETIMMMSCKSAVKANDKLTEVEAREIIDKVLADETLLKCPHGRPTLIKLTKKDIEKMFKRI